MQWLLHHAGFLQVISFPINNQSKSNHSRYIVIVAHLHQKAVWCNDFYDSDLNHAIISKYISREYVAVYHLPGFMKTSTCYKLFLNWLSWDMLLILNLIFAYAQIKTCASKRYFSKCHAKKSIDPKRYLVKMPGKRTDNNRSNFKWEKKWTKCMVSLNVLNNYLVQIRWPSCWPFYSILRDKIMLYF